MDESRALGALYGLAVGDALGMPTQSLPRARIVAAYGGLVGTFEPAPPDHPLAAGLPAGSVTDDTEQALLLARLLIEGGGRVDPAELARRLLAWERSMRERGSLDLLGPSTRRAIGELLAGADIDLAGRLGVTNGAAMRIAPVGIASSRCGSWPAGRPGGRGQPGHAQHRRRPGRRGGGGGRGQRRDRRGHGPRGHPAGGRGRGARRRARALGGGRRRRRPDPLGRGADRRADPGRGRGGGEHAGRDQPGRAGVGPGRVRGARGQPGRSVAGVPAGRVRGRRLRHDRGDGRRRRRGVPRG